MSKFGIYGDVANYSFPLAGRYVLIAAVDTPMPSTVTPITNAAFPAGYTYLGPTEKGQVIVTYDRTTVSAFTGVIQTERQRVLTAQSGSIETTLQFYTPSLAAYATGQGPIVTTAPASPSRGFAAMGVGGTLGSRQTLLVVEDWHINLVSDDGSATYEQGWIYAPRTINDGPGSLSDFIDNFNALKAKWSLFGYTNTTFGDRNLLLEHRWLNS